MDPSFLTTNQLAKRWNMAPVTLRLWRWSGKGPDYHKLGGRIRYYMESIIEFEKEQLRQHTSMPHSASFKNS